MGKGKRAHKFEDRDDDTKRIRSNDGSPAPAPASITPSTDAKQAAADRIAALKAKLAAAKKPESQEPTPTPVQSAEEIKKAEALKKIAEIRARSSAQREQSTAPQQQGESDLKARIAEARARAAALAEQRKATSSPAVQQVSNDLQTRIAEARARAAELNKERNSRQDAPPQAPPRQEGNAARGGLGIGIHPSLLGNQEPVSKSKAKRDDAEPQEKRNPYLPAEDEEDLRRDEGTYDTSIARKSAQRKAKPLVFIAQGKYIAQSIAAQEQKELEDMKRRIAMESRKISQEEAPDKAFLVPKPPEVEWWDEALLDENHKTYEDWEKHNRIEAADSIVTAYVQHPVLLPPPQDKFLPAPKPMMLTTKEMKKLRRQRRMADMKEEQAKIRLGLIDPPAPKVKKSNMMRVYGEQAVKDPTAVEARVNKEIADRANGHELANAERKLTKEQRAEKLKQQQAGDAAKGIKIAVFKINNLSSGKHRFQVDINAKQNDLRGIVILHPEMNLVIIEGGVHSVTAYKKLMLNRIKWSENTQPLTSNSSATFTAAAARNINRDLIEGPSAIDTWLNPVDENNQLKDLSYNRCLLVWEGDEREFSFRKWGSRVCETDGEAREALGRSKMENMWELAKGTTE